MGLFESVTLVVPDRLALAMLKGKGVIRVANNRTNPEASYFPQMLLSALGLSDRIPCNSRGLFANLYVRDPKLKPKSRETLILRAIRSYIFFELVGSEKESWGRCLSRQVGVRLRKWVNLVQDREIRC